MKILLRTFYLFAIAMLFHSCYSSKYVNYLEEQTEIVSMKDSLIFETLDSNFFNNKLFFVGEIHEVETSPRIDFAMFKQINDAANLDVYIAEMDLIQGFYLEQYIQGSDQIPLDSILAEWVVYIGSISSQYRSKWKQLRDYYASLPSDRRFRLYGIDRIADYDLLRFFLKQQLPESLISSIPSDDDKLGKWADSYLSPYLARHKSNFNKEIYHILDNIYFNLSNSQKIRSRDKFMYENFRRLHLQKAWSKKKIYGGFGFAHTVQAYPYTLAGRLKKDTLLSYEDKMVSMNALYVDSRLTVQSAALPKFLQDKGKPFTRFRFGYDSILFMYIKGIADYKKVTESNSISLIKLESKDSPYLYSARGTKTMKLIPIWEGFDIIEGSSTTDYAQYIFFVRNADWIIPDAE